MIRRVTPMGLALALAACLGCNSDAGNGGLQGRVDSPRTGDGGPVDAPTTPAESAAPAADGVSASTPAAAPINLAAVELSEVEVTNIKMLPPEDAELALKQKVCPIGEGHLGSEDMGVPVKVTAPDGRSVFLCCGGCKRPFEKDPAAALAKLGMD